MNLGGDTVDVKLVDLSEDDREEMNRYPFPSAECDGRVLIVSGLKQFEDTMSEEIKVHVVNRARRYLYMRYFCPDAGRFIELSTKQTNLKDANREAAKWEDQLRGGRYRKQSRMTWEAFRDFYSANALPALAPRTAETYESAALNVFSAACNPLKLADVTTAKITEFASRLRREGKAEATISHYLRHLKAAARWANRQGLLATVPSFTMPKRAKGAKMMRGRPITGEEFDRMIVAVPRGIGARPNTKGIDAVTPWRFYSRPVANH